MTSEPFQGGDSSARLLLFNKLLRRKHHQSREESLWSEAKTMKMKTWTVIANTGKQADLESGLEKKEFKKPPHISTRDFTYWLAANSHHDDDSLRSLFKL